uniref:C-type lectin domain-containing protein n=1 Tax=Panagrolaimus sp. PS1159 TaxID=55785 RepID=A0AC35FYX8_9BILA
MLFFVLLFLLIENSVADCPQNTTEYNSNCYSFYDNLTGFADAELKCEKAGGHLASIHDGLANALLAQEGIKALHTSTETDFWIGATNLMKPPTWNWTDGSTFDFTDWKKGEPQNTSGNNCAVLSMTDGYWSAQDCFMQKPFVCKVPSTPNYPLNYNCSAGWFYFAQTHSCYGANAFAFRSNWTAAEKYCKDSGAILPSIHSYAEFQLILSYVYAYWLGVWTSSTHCRPIGDAWVGAQVGTIIFENELKNCPFEITENEIIFLEEETHIFRIRSSYYENVTRKYPCKWRFSAPKNYGFKIVIEVFNVSNNVQFFIRNSKDIIVNKRSAKTFHPFYNEDTWIDISISGSNPNFVPKMEFQAYITVINKTFELAEESNVTVWTSIDEKDSGYSKNVHCTFNLVISPNTMVLAVSDISLESGVDYVRYSQDNYIVNIGNDVELILEPYKNGTERHVLWEFVSDGSLQFYGFEMKFTTYRKLK